jgi:hypothetical protein
MESAAGADDSRWTLTKAPGMGGLQGKNKGLPSSRKPLKRLQIGLVPKSGRLLPTLTIMLAGWLSPEDYETPNWMPTFFHCLAKGQGIKVNSLVKN